MARPSRPGLLYFPMDVDFFQDDKIVFVAAKFPECGEIVALKLLCKIYKDYGFFIPWGEDDSALFSRQFNGAVSAEKIDEIISVLLKKNFFEKTMYSKHKILTSNGIQNRYEKICKLTNKVSLFNLYPKYVLCGENGLSQTKPGIKSDQTGGYVGLSQTKPGVKSEFSTQSKVKESKVKESKESVARMRDTRAHEKNFNFSFDQVTKYCAEKGYRFDPERFWNYYAARSWKFKGGIPIENLEAALDAWNKTGFENQTEKFTKEITGKKFRDENKTELRKIN